MTRELTADDLRVERDRLLEGGRTPEQVERMQAVASGFVWLAEEHLDYEGETALAVCFSEAEAQRAAERHHAQFGVEPISWVRRPADSNNLTGFGGSHEYWISKLPLVSPPETTAGASTPRPPGETP